MSQNSSLSGSQQRAAAALRRLLRPLAPGALVDESLVFLREGRTENGDAALAGATAIARVASDAARDRPERLGALPRVLGSAAELLAVSRPALTVVVAELAFAETLARLLPPLLATRAMLELLTSLGELNGATLWTRNEGDEIAPVCSVGSGADGQRARELAAALIESGEPGDGGGLLSLPVVRHGDPVAALTLRARRDRSERTLRLAELCTRSLAPVVDRSMLLERRAATERILVESGEHRLRRVGLDLHDGPLQSAAQLAGELKLLREQVAELELPEPQLERMRGRLDDVLARLSSLDEELRQLASGFESPVVLNASFETALAEEVAAFERRSGKRTQFSLDGSLDGLSPSQRIALYRMLQEALSNVRQHSGARTVTVRIAAEAAGVRAEIVDDGVGFDPARAAQTGHRKHLGLAGIRERALLLGGSARVESRRGGPSRVSIFLPASARLPELVDDLVWALESARER